MKKFNTLRANLPYFKPFDRQVDKRKHGNKKFYTSYKWRKFRAGYIDYLTQQQLNDVQHINLPDPYKLGIIDKIPVCEECLDQHIKGFRPGVKTGTELDHITPINPENAYDDKGVYGLPLDIGNVQLLCKRCHAEKSGKDKLFHKKYSKDESI